MKDVTKNEFEEIIKNDVNSKKAELVLDDENLDKVTGGLAVPIAKEADPEHKYPWEK